MKIFICILIITFNLLAQQTPVTLIYPQDGSFVEYFESSYPVTWSGPPEDSVLIYYSLNNGVSWISAITHSVNDNLVMWNVPDTTGSCIIKITAKSDTNNYDKNELPFTIYSVNYNFTSANEISWFFYPNGTGAYNWGNIYWPGGLNGNLTATYYDGLWLSGLVNNEKRANASIFQRSGFRPGVILDDGTASNPTDTLYRIWKITNGWESLPPGPERDSYEFDYKNWPAEIGAPWSDMNGDAVFTRGVDIPRYIGDETLWYVSNDVDTPKCLNVFGSLPLGLEFQVTTWSYKSDNLKDVVFRKYKVINKGQNFISDLILGCWSDDDLGNYGDDYPGCDSSLNLGYVFNGDNDDEGYYGIAPPAIGRIILQGPVIPSIDTDSAFINEQWRRGYKNLKMSAYGPGFRRPDLQPIDPSIVTYEGTLEVYNLLRGLKNNGDSLIDPHTNLATIFSLSGDPEKGTGWYCGQGWPGGPSPGDSRSLVPCGPFNMAPGDTNEFVVAVLLKRGISNTNSVTKLKEYAVYLQNWYKSDFITSTSEEDNFIPNRFSISQNFPNPFNPVTNIQYSVSGRQNVEIKVFDIIGNEITTLVNKEQAEGKYTVRFDAGGLASGIYFYSIKAGSFSETKKMVLMK